MISRLSDTSLNAFYYTLKTDAYDHSVWNDVTVSKAVEAVPGSLEEQPLFLSIDDTMVEKSGKHFELCSKLYDHAAHNGSNYLNGHCMVSLLLSFPVYQNGKILYLSVPVGYRLWDKEKSKLALAAELTAQAMKTIGPQRQVILLCDSWYPKAEVAALVDQFENLEMVCNARVDTALYGLAPARTGKGSRRLFLCTADPGSICFDWENSADKTACFYGAENIFYLPLAWYGLRWNIEVSYYEGKTFWSMEEYRIRSKERIERLVNLISLSYSAMTLLTYSDETFSGYELKDSINGRLFGLFTKGEYRCNNRCGIEMPIMIFEHDRERKSFEEWFLSVDRELKQNIRSKIEEDAIMQHIVGKEERDGKPELGVKDVALAFALYKRWRKIRKFTEE